MKKLRGGIFRQMHGCMKQHGKFTDGTKFGMSGEEYSWGGMVETLE